VVKFNNTIKLYFSDHIMDEVRKTVDETKYAGVIDQLKSMVFTGDRQEGGYNKSIIDQATFRHGMTLEAFLQVIDQMFDMAEICGTEYTDESKLSSVAVMIERGDCNYLKRVIEQSEYDELKYDKTVKKLIRACKMKLLRTNPPDATMEEAT
jgi:hypothetical protein